MPSTFPKFKKIGIERSQLNVFLKPLTEIQQAYSDNRNGYYIASEVWGSCFFRNTTTRNCIEIYAHDGKTFTKIPTALFDKTYILYVNHKDGESFKVTLPTGARVVGMCAAQPSKDEKWWNHCALVYCPQGEPIVEAYNYEDKSYQNTLFLESRGEVNAFTIFDLMRSQLVRRIWVNNDFFPITKHNRSEGDDSVADLVAAAGKARGRNMYVHSGQSIDVDKHPIKAAILAANAAAGCSSKAAAWDWANKSILAAENKSNSLAQKVRAAMEDSETNFPNAAAALAILEVSAEPRR